jgi:sirohydrochlorin cobaltochelatase
MTVHGLILLAHGARDPAWRGPFDAIAARVRERAPEAVVRLAFLELMAPSMADAGAELAALGCACVDVVPVFLGTGGHVRRDVPALIAALRESHPGVAWTLHDALGESPHVVAALADAALAAAGLAFDSAHDAHFGIAP